MNVIPAHQTIWSGHCILVTPAHEPRASDPHYAVFEAARKRILRQGIGCWICGTHEKLELHHSEVEFSLINGIDWQRFAADHPTWKIMSDDDFLKMMESEGNLLCLCEEHHRSVVGIHSVPEPNWKAQRWAKQGTVFVQAADAKGS